MLPCTSAIAHGPDPERDAHRSLIGTGRPRYVCPGVAVAGSQRVATEAPGRGGSVVELEPDARAPVLARHAPAACESLDDEQAEAAVVIRSHRAWTRSEPRPFVGHLHAQEPGFGVAASWSAPL